MPTSFLELLWDTSGELRSWFLSLEEGGEGCQGGYGRGNVVRAKRGTKAGAEGSVDIFYRKHDGCFHCDKKTIKGTP